MSTSKHNKRFYM